MNNKILNFKSGFVSIIGKPNLGKSTLMNTLIGQKLSIITSKAQTTRHRILGILNGKDFQIIFSDTPGIINPKYALQKSMIKESYGSIIGADVILWVIDIYEKELDQKLIEKCNKENIPLIILINKIDLLDPKINNKELKGNISDKLNVITESTNNNIKINSNCSSLEEENKEKPKRGNNIKDLIKYWNKLIPTAQIIPISALKKINIEKVVESILKLLPKHPPYYSEEMITDKPEKFFASEIIREKIFINYHQEIPYSSEVVIDNFKEEEKIIKIKALIYVERDSQKYILIGKKGLELKKIGISARLELEEFLNKKVYLELFVKVSPNWRKKTSSLSKFGYR